jgi:hypothetical protein
MAMWCCDACNTRGDWDNRPQMCTKCGSIHIDKIGGTFIAGDKVVGAVVMYKQQEASSLVDIDEVISWIESMKYDPAYAEASLRLGSLDAVTSLLRSRYK